MKLASKRCAVRWLIALGLLAGCTEATRNLTGGAGPSVGPRDASEPEDARRPDAPMPPDAGRDSAATDDAGGPRAMCGNRLCQCDDGKDNDRDGLSDGIDPECTAPFDDREETFATGRPKGPPNVCQDCFWDGNIDSKDDGCSRAPSCIETGIAPPAMSPAACEGCDVDATCVDGCRKYTPNGCDCFGCCDVTRPDGTSVQLLLGDECSLAMIDHEDKCPPCFKSTQCENPCGRCELCLGKPMSDLPADCEQEPEEPQHVCDDGSATCSETTACAVDYYCVLGCCMPALL